MDNRQDFVNIQEELKLKLKESNKLWKKVLKGLVLLLAVGYTIMPVDLLPDAIPFVGGIDDSGVWIGNLIFYLREIKKSKTEIEKVISDITHLIDFK